MLAEIPFVLLLTGAGLLGLYMANLAYDHGMPQYLSRKIGHLGGGVVFLLSPLLFSSFQWPFRVVVAFTVLLLATHGTSLFRGVGGSARPGALAEVHFPATGVLLIGTLWGVLNEPWLATVPLLFMAFGDAVTGLIRSAVYNKEVKGVWGSLGMVMVCLLLASFITPYWIGIAGAVTATLAEKFTKTSRFFDDNLTIPLSSALVMWGLKIVL